MNAAIVCLGGLLAFALGYRYYSRFLADKVFELRADEPVPANEQEDGVDFVPTNKHVLFGHHFSSIAGAAPIIGPAVAIIWGWVPAVLWVVFGTVFMGAVHDFSVLVLSIRHRGESVGSIIAEVVGPRTKSLFQFVIFFLVMLAIAVFAKLIAKLFVAQPGSVLPINFEIIVAVLIGITCYRRQKFQTVAPILALLALYGMVFVGVKVPLRIDGLFGEHTHTAWVVMLLAYSFVASVLPVWLLLQPRDYINSHQLFVGLAAMILGILIAQPEITAPAFQVPPSDAPSASPIPFLFVTIACGAISGFHGLVASGTTSKQVSCAKDARMIGYGGTLGEGLLALIATLAVSAGLSEWGAHYESFSQAASSGISNFVTGAGSFIAALGIPTNAAQVVAAVLAVSFAATSLDTGVRIQRYLLQEVAAQYRIPALGNAYVASLVAVVLPLLLILSGKAMELWALFGASNQLLAVLSLTVVMVWQAQRGRPWLVVAVPLFFVMLVASLAMAQQVGIFVEHGRYLLAALGSAILALEVWVLFEGALAMRRRGDAEPLAT